MFGKNKYGQVPPDEEIERDVAELRRLLDGVDGPAEPHPAYYQNFLIRVRERVDEERFRRKRWAPSLAWSSLSAAALVVVLMFSGVIPSFNGGGGEELANGPRPNETSALTPSNGNGALAAAEPLYSGEKSLVLSDDDVNMLNAIMSTNDDAIFEAMIDSESL